MKLSNVWNRLRGQDVRRQRVSQSPTAPAAVESLETRQMLSTSTLFIPATGELNIELNNRDSVRVSSVSGSVVIEVATNGGGYTPTSAIGTLATSSVVSLVVLGGDDSNTIDLNGVTSAAFTGLTSISVDAANGQDTIVGSPDFADRINGGNGNDNISGQGGADIILGGDGNDTILGGDGNDSINSGDGNDSVSGEDGSDVVTLGNGQDTFRGGNDDDSCLAGNGQDSLDGDAGNDTLNGDGGTDTVNGGDGNDSILGGEFADILNGDADNDTINGQGGNDSVDGGTGNDNLIGVGGNDTLLGNDGNDVINGGAGADSLVGNDGDDAIVGGTGNDVIFGDSTDTSILETGNDSVNGQAGDDTIIGGRGADTLNGGAGADLVQSFFTGTEVTVTPPPLPPTPPPTPTLSGGAFPDATDSGAGVNVGAENTMSTGSGDASVIVATDATGRFGTASGLNAPFTSSGATYDPVGATLPDTSTFESYVFYRTGINGTGNRQQLDQAATNVSAIRGTNNESNSTFTIGNLGFALTQTTTPTTGSSGAQNGSLLTQTYRITNTGSVADSFELVRYIDGDLQFDGTIADGGGRLNTSAGDELLFETDAGGGGATATTFLGITGRGGTAPATNRFEIDDYVGSPNLLGRIAAGTALDGLIVGDSNADGFIENGQEYDVTLGFRNEFTIAPGQTVIYTTHTIFGSGAPTAIVPPNTLPVANPNSGTSNQGLPVTLDVVSDDTDADGVLDFTTVAVATPPANGVAVSLGNGLITYTPNAGFSGTDTFTYTVTDDRGGVSNPATVTITVIGAEAVGDLILGGDENDTLIGSLGNDTINGQSGDDSILGGGGNDSLFGGQGNDTLDGQAGDDTLDGQGGDDSLIGGDGNDTFVSAGTGAGNDTVDGGDGFNSIVVNGNGSANTIEITAPDGVITVTNSGASMGVGANIQAVTVNGLSGDDLLTIGDLSAVEQMLIVVNGGDGNDTITGQGANIGGVRLLLNGDNGNDTINGSEGADTINGGDGNDVANGRGGNDNVIGSDGNDNLAGGADNDTVLGGNGNDFLTGQTGDDSIVGGDGNDILRGFEGADTLLGQAGDDVLNGMDGDDSILGGVGKDQLTGDAGTDTLDGGRNDDTISGGDGNDLIRGDHGNDAIDAGDGNDTVNSGDGNDTITAGLGNDLLNAGDGNDYVNAGGGNDTLVGGDGNDTLLGGSGIDVILGGDGDDFINGQGGTDTIAGNQGLDTILDPASEIDEQFVLSAGLIVLLDAA